MKFWPQSVSIAAAALLASTVSHTKVKACVSAFSMPQSHFEGVDYQGYVFHVEKIGYLQMSSDVKLPMYLTFSSRRETVSPYVGYGWEIPLLESKIVQLDENNFRLDQPDGWFRPFWRDIKNPTLLHASGWEAEIHGNTITAWASCGMKLTFRKGRIVSMQLKDRKLDYLYEDNQVSQIREGSTTVLKVEREPSTGEVIGLNLGNNQRIGLECDQRPRVQVAGVKVFL